MVKRGRGKTFREIRNRQTNRETRKVISLVQINPCLISAQKADDIKEQFQTKFARTPLENYLKELVLKLE